MAGKRNINRLRKAMNNNSVSSTVKKTADTVKKAAQSTAVSTAVKSGASAARQAAHSSSQYNGESQRSVIKSGEKQRRLQELSKKNEKLEQNNTFLSGMKKYTDKNARLKGSSGKQVTAKELQQATKDIQKETAKKGKGKKLSDDKLVNLTKGNLRQTAGSHMKTVGTTAQNSAGNIVPASAGSTASALIGSKYRKQVEESRKTAQKEGGKMISKKGTEQIDKGSKEIEKGTKGLGKAGKFAADLYGTGLGMATDRLAGPMSLGAMFSRSYGSAYDTAEKEGADTLQATLHGAGIGGIEAGTEKMFAVAKPLKKLYGAGMGDDIAEALLNKIVKKTSSKAGKNLAYHGGKVTLSALSEGLEEMVSEGLEPAVANKIYAEATGTPHSTTVKDVLYSGAVGGAMGGILGGAGQVVEYGQGRRVQNVFGEDGVKALAKAAKEVDDAGAAVKGSAINEMINRGEGIAAGQANELYKAVYEQEIKDLERNDIVNRSAERIMKRENLISPVTVDSRTGEMMVGKKTMESYTAQKAEAEKAINELSKEETDLSLPDLTKDQIASAVAAVQTGVAGVDEINLFTTGNSQARAVYESVTGKTLPKTNAGTREMLYRESGMNRVESARAETKSRVDEVKGLIGQDMGKYYESAGQEAFSQAFGDVNIGNAAQVDDMINTFDDFYRAGRNDIGYDTVISYQNPVHSNVSSEVKKAAWEAGQQDKILATETAKGLQMKIGETAKKNRSQRKMSAYKGRLYSELSNENKAKFTASQQAMLRALARVFNIDIHVVDAVENGANGYYKDGKMYISMEADRALEYVFAHEITHHMQQYAPEEYNELKELVRESWAQQGGIDEAVDFKVAQYAQHGVELSREDALDEILADSTYEVLQDETFVEELCRENRSIAQSILNAIKDVLKKLRSLLADGDRFTPAQNAQLLSNLDILKEFEKKWTDGLLRSVENRDAVMRSGVDTVKYSKKNDNSTIKEQLRENLNKLDDMKPVADVKYESIKHLNRSEKAKAIMSEYNKKFKGGVERRGFGFIVLREDEVTGSLKYLYTDGEFAAFKTLPQVLKRGEIIEGHTNHKGRAVNTITIAAPVTINGTTGYMAAAVKTGGKNRYHVHRILMPDGSEFEFNKKTEPTGAGVPIENDSKGSAISSVSENSVTPTGRKSNKRFSLKEPVEENEVHEYEVGDDEERIAKVNEVAEHKDVKFSLKNENLSPDARIPYTVYQSYISVKKNDNAALKNLQDSVRKLKRGTYENKATGYKADINRVTIGKILNPSGGNGFNRWSKKYIDNLNAATQLPELFENAVYVDTKENQKSKKANQQIQGYHHFVAPIYMDGKEYRARIVAREKQNSDVLYIVETEIMPIKNGSSGSRSKASYFVSVPFDISIPELVNGVKIYDYNMQKNDIYNHNDIKYSMPDEASVIDYMNEQETEFADLTGFRDYEVKAKQVRQQTYGELVAQVEKLKNDKRFTKGKVLDESSVREEINDMIVTLMSYSESYNSLGVRKKTDHNLVREGVNAAKQIFTAMKKGDVSDVVTKAELAAQQIVENLKLVEDTAYVEYKDLRDYLRTTRMVISEEDAADIPDFKQFKKSNFGRIRIVSQNGIPVDTAYQELMERYPELFSDEITHPADMLRAIADVRESLEPYDIMLSAEETEQLMKQTAQDLIDIAATGKAWKSWADKKKEQYDEKLKMLKQRQREALRDVKKKERDRAEKKLEKERQKGKERLDKAKEKNAEKLQREKDRAKEKAERQKDSKERKRLLAGIEQNRKWLSDRLSKPTDDKHIPEGFRTALADLLSKIDMQSQKSKILEEKTGQRARRWAEMDELKARFAEIAKEDGSGSFEYDGYIFEIMESLAKKLAGRSVDEASTQELQEFDVLMKYIANGIKNYNKAFDESIKEDISQLALESMDNAKARQAKLKDGMYVGRSGILGGMNTILNESMVTPRDFFERIGGGLEKTFMGLRRGMDRHVDNMTKTREFFEEIFKEYNNKKKPGSKIEEWRSGKQVTTFDVQGGKIRLTPAQVMSLYCLAKREQAMGHILGSGIVASRVDSASKIGKMLGAKIQTGGPTMAASMEDIVKITESLTQEQKAMADKLQGFLNDECSEWGNEVSMRLYGYRKFTEENYFPIRSADAYLDSNFEGRDVSERIKNFGFTKGTVVNANNPIMIDDIFSVVSDHINKMSLYNAFAAPISDFTRVYNYKSRDDAGNIDGSVKSAVEQAYGKKAINYISNFMADLNNQTKMHTDGILGFVNKSLANYKKSAIGGNLRVALQQPTAVARSFVCINPKYFANGKVNLKKNLKDMKEHCQIARWKSWGFSQVDMARDIDQIMMNNEWSRLDLATMQIYGFLDDVTWSTIWAAVRTETKAKHKNVQVDSEEFYRICNERASEIFDKTQVVDSVFHRSQAMRNKQVMSKMVTSFMAEPTRTFNMMRTEFLLAKDMWQEGNKAKAVGKVARATSVFTFNAALCSAAAAAADVLRGRTPNDDDDDSWLANFFANFWDNVNPLNMIPVVKDIWGYADGWDASNMAMEGWEKLVQGTMDFIQSPSTDGFLNMCDGLGYVTGLPIKNVRREFKSALKALGIESFAAEEGKEETADKKSIMDKIFGSFNIKDGSRMDNFLNHFNINLTDEEKAEKEYKDQVREIEKDIKGLSGSEKEEKIWSEATKNYTKYIEDGDMESVARCRRMLESFGGDVDKFDESVKSKVKTALKKNIGEDADPHKTWQYRNYLAQNGMNASQISSEVVAKSDTAKEFQIALCMDDEDAAVDSLSYLIAAGISYEDMYVLFVNRTKAIKASDFSTGEFAYPVSGEITSAFGGRESPGGIGSTDHKGIDIGVAMNSDVAAADGGKVTYAGWNGGYGYMVRVDHGNGRVTEYAHLNGYYVQKGQSVKKGEVIALSGSTGNSTGPHLHFGVKQNGTYVDPMIYF